MVNTCCVIGCTNRAKPGSKLSFYLIPTVIKNQGAETERLSKKRREAWISSIRRKNWTPSGGSRVCSVHFIKGYYMQFRTLITIITCKGLTNKIGWV